MIAKELGYTPARISQIINSDHGQALVSRATERMRQRFEEEIEGHLVTLAHESVLRLKSTIEFDDFALGSDAKKHQDNVALQILKGAGFLGSKSNDESKSTQLTDALAGRLIDALEATKKVDEIHDAEYEVVSDE